MTRAAALSLVFFGFLVQAEAQTFEDLLSHQWIVSIGLNDASSVPVAALDGNDSTNLYLRRFSSGGFYVDGVIGEQVTVLGEPDRVYTMEFSPDGRQFERLPSVVPIVYERMGNSQVDGYAGRWQIRESGVEVEIVALEDRDWLFLLYFPGDPFSGIRRGYYPFYESSPGTYRSSTGFIDSELMLSYDEQSDTYALEPLFAIDGFPEELFDPVRLWRRP